MYLNLMKSGFSLNDIDEMDVHWYFEVMNQEEEVEQGFIDQLW